jgi:hypothetical protein
MPHAAWWVGLLQLLLLVAATVLAARARANVPGLADLSHRAGLMARLHGIMGAAGRLAEQ